MVTIAKADRASDGTSLLSRRQMALAWLAGVVSWGLLLFTYKHLENLVDGGVGPAMMPFIDEMTGAVAGGMVFFGVLFLVRRFPLTRDRWLARLPIYGIALIVSAAGATTLMWGQRKLLYPLAGLGDYDYGKMPLRYFMELPMEAIVFIAMVAGSHAVRVYRKARERELHAAQLESSLAQAQLRNLRLQLQPHFLFNALNTISSTMYDNPAAADEMLDQLSELLRASLRSAQTDEVPLRAELELLDRYVSIMKARFGDRLQVDRQIQPGIAAALIPSMIMQPLVENAIRHGNATAIGRGRIEIRGERRGERIVLEVEDDGPGCDRAPDQEGAGVGLAATAERLRLLYGSDQSFETGHGAVGGFVVRASFPFHTREEAGR